MFKRLILSILAIALIASASPLSWQTFSNGKITWICSSNDIYVFSSDSRTIYPLVLDQTRSVGKISDIVQYEQTLLVSTEAGVYQIDMSTQSIERISFPNEKNKAGKIASDMDYLWVASDDTLYRFDKLGREWMSYPFKGKMQIKTIQSNGNIVECFADDNLLKFEITTERWSVTKSKLNLSDSVTVIRKADNLFATKDSRFFIYDKELSSWNEVDIGYPITDIVTEQPIFLSGADKVFQIDKRSSKSLDIKQSGQILCFSKIDDTLYLAYENRIIKFNTVNNKTEIIDYPPQVTGSEILKLISSSSFIIAAFPNNIAIYDGERRGWKIDQNTTRKKVQQFSWSEDGPRIQYSPGYYSTLKGQFESMTALKTNGYEKDTTYKNGKKIIDSTLLVSFALPNYIADVNFHTSDPKDRTADLSFSNSNTSVPPTKNFRYKGLTTDYLNILQAGTCNSNLLQSQALPPVQFEGGQAVFTSSKKLPDRDRNYVKAGGGTGYITSQTKWKTLSFRSDGKYLLKDTTKDSTNRTNDTTQIVPGSLKVYVDGMPLDEDKYTYISRTGILRIDRSAPVDPVSLITVSYTIQTIPDAGLARVEFIPDNNFGRLYYGELTVSPVSWFSSRTGVIQTEDAESNVVAHVGLPFELRKKSPDLMLKFTPDFNYNTENGSTASGLSLQSRVGNKVSFVFDGQIIDTDFVPTDTVSHGYGMIRNEYSTKISYDVLPEIPISYSQHSYDAEYGKETKYSFDGGIHFTKYPYLDINVSRNVLDSNSSDTNNIFDSIFHIKDKIGLRLYESSSDLFQKYLHVKKLSYEISHSEYQYRSFADSHFFNGRRTSGWFSLMPIQKITVLGDLIYNKNDNQPTLPSSSVSPSFEIQVIDVPAGIDFTGQYNIIFSKYYDLYQCTDTLNRKVDMKIRPGQWFSQLRWLSLQGTIDQRISSTLLTNSPSLKSIILAKGINTGNIDVKSIGLSFFPNDAILFKNDNGWKESDSADEFKTTNDFQWQINRKNILQSSIIYTKTDYYSTIFKLSHDYSATSWLRILPEVNGNYETDSIGRTISGGPKLSSYISFISDRKLFLRSLLNIQSFNCKWDFDHKKVHLAGPDMSYSFTLRFIIRPKIQFVNNEQIEWENGKFKSFSGKLTTTIFF